MEEKRKGRKRDGKEKKKEERYQRERRFRGGRERPSLCHYTKEKTTERNIIFIGV